MKNYELQSLLKEMPDNYDMILEGYTEEGNETFEHNIPIVNAIKNVRRGQIVLDTTKILQIEEPNGL